MSLLPCSKNTGRRREKKPVPCVATREHTNIIWEATEASSVEFSDRYDNSLKNTVLGDSIRCSMIIIFLGLSNIIKIFNEHFDVWSTLSTEIECYIGKIYSASGHENIPLLVL